MDKTASALISGTAVLLAATVGAPQWAAAPRRCIWYARLRKPGFTPPGPVVGAAWSVLELLLAAAGYRLLQARRGPSRSMAVGTWALTLAGLAAIRGCSSASGNWRPAPSRPAPCWLQRPEPPCPPGRSTGPPP